ncbi:MAG: hypothetical protein ACQEQC_00435 [Elusimicrobiota bacterium]
MNKNHIKTFCLLLCGIFLGAGCSSDNVKLEGKVWDAHKDPSTNLIVIDGPASDGIVWAQSEPDNVAECDNDGNYELELEAPFSIGSTPSRVYTLIANYQGSDEQISVTASLGETNQVRDFVIYEHHEESWESPRDSENEEGDGGDIPEL